MSNKDAYLSDVLGFQEGRPVCVGGRLSHSSWGPQLMSSWLTLFLTTPVGTCFTHRIWKWERLTQGSGERQETGEGISDEMIHEQSYEDNRKGPKGPGTQVCWVFLMIYKEMSGWSPESKAEGGKRNPRGWRG